MTAPLHTAAESRPLRASPPRRAALVCSRSAWRWGLRAAAAILLGLAGWILWREAHGVSARDLDEALRRLGAARLGVAGLVLVASFACLGLIEAAALSWAGARVGLAQALAGGLAANAVGHALGVAVLTGAAVRARLYRPLGLSFSDVGKVSVFAAVAFGLGMALLAGVSLALGGGAMIHGLDQSCATALGAGIALVPLAYLVAVARGPAWPLLGHALPLPTGRVAAAQVLLGSLDNLAVAALIWLLLGNAGATFTQVALAYAVATLLGLLTSAPGGVGTFEAAMLTLLPQVERPALLAALIGYRAIYYGAPLAAAAPILLAGLAVPTRVVGLARAMWRSSACAVLAAAGLALGAGSVLTGIGRIAPASLAVIRDRVPLPVLETSQYLSLATGLALAACAPALLRGRRRAVWIAAAAAGVGASTALLRALDVGLATGLAGYALALVLSRAMFRRRAARRPRCGEAAWSLAVMFLIVMGALGLGLWTYADTPYEARLWTEFRYPGDPERFLRGVALLAGLSVVWGVWTLVRGRALREPPAEPEALRRIRPLVAASPDTTARLALLGDKALLCSTGGGACLPYAAAGRSLVAMGDPIGEPTEAATLVWRFLELAEVLDARPVFYQVGSAHLGRYLDAGLSLLKLGEEARIPLAAFDLAGSARRSLRQAHARALREGLRFQVVLPPLAEALLAEMAAVSEDWLVTQGRRELGFSLGRFDRDVLRHDPVALVRREGRLLAFANIWDGGGVEASVDLMRHRAPAPRGVMDFLFVELILWSRAQGYAWFNLGMAPLSGLAEHRLAAPWHRVGLQIARRGEHLYGFAGLRAFKAKFGPVWMPRYLAAPPLSAAPALLDVIRLIRRPAPPARVTTFDPVTRRS